jgi:hypothetical protein
MKKAIAPTLAMGAVGILGFLEADRRFFDLC